MSESENVLFFRISATKATGMENIAVDMPSWNPVTGEQCGTTVDDMKSAINNALNLFDDRAKEAQLRVLQAYGVLKYFESSVQSKIIEIIDILTGKADPELVVARWQAADEENAALIAGRYAANGEVV